jgi:hypothetical protein
METTQTMPEWRAAADEIWAVLKETEHIMRQNAERSADLDKKFDRIAKENAERSVALDKKFDRLGLNVGGLNRSLGELIETLIAARLWEKFPEHGFARAYRRVPVYDETNRVRTDIDILLSDTDRVMAVEVKHELDRLKDVEEHLKRMELIRNYPPAETVNKQWTCSRTRLVLSQVSQKTMIFDKILVFCCFSTVVVQKLKFLNNSTI